MAQQSGSPGDRGRYGAEYEEFVSTVYLEMVRLGHPTRQGLRRPEWSEADIDEAVAELTARGFLLATDSPDAWQVVSPREAVPRHLQAVEHRAALARATIAELDDEWRRALGRGVLSSLPDLDVLSSIPEIVERVLAMHHAARGRLWWAMDASGVILQLLARSREEPDLLRVAPGVEVRVVLDTSLLAHDDAHAFMERSERAGHGVRVGRGVPFGAMVCDEQSVLADISAYDPDGYGSLELRRAPARQAVTRLVEEIWSLSTPYGPTARVLDAGGEAGPTGVLAQPLAPLDDRDQRVLALLATGASDQTIARQTNVSVRTVERRVRYLTEHLGAATRFQAGVQAVRRGWV